VPLFYHSHCLEHGFSKHEIDEILALAYGFGSVQDYDFDEKKSGFLKKSICKIIYDVHARLQMMLREMSPVNVVKKIFVERVALVSSATTYRLLWPPQ
jgi:hypothetical protein